jgi:mono/diheme cytochrome c family protein
MPSYAAQLSASERWAVVAYVKQLQRTPSSTRAAVEDSVRALAVEQNDSIISSRKPR